MNNIENPNNTNIITRTTTNQQETIALGKQIGALLQPGMCITLVGDLGAGKTTFTKGIARGLHITKEVNSPTFTIMKRYTGDMVLHHIDAYRLEGLHQDLGFEEYLEADGVSVVEWPEYIEFILPANRLAISIAYGEDDNRVFTIAAHGAAYQRLIEELA